MSSQTLGPGQGISVSEKYQIKLELGLNPKGPKTKESKISGVQKPGVQNSGVQTTKGRKNQGSKTQGYKTQRVQKPKGLKPRGPTPTPKGSLNPRVQNLSYLQGQLSMKAINSGSWLSKIGPTSLQITFLGPIRPL